jgi:hypothetical protein
LLDRVRQALWERQVFLTCPSCGKEEWKGGFGELGNLRVMLPGVTGHGDVLATPEQIGGLATYPLICSNCGFVRLHALAVLGIEEPE